MTNKYTVINKADLLTILNKYGLTYRELGEILGTDSGTISRFIHGSRYRTSKEDMVKKIEILRQAANNSNFTKRVLLWLIRKL